MRAQFLGPSIAKTKSGCLAHGEMVTIIQRGRIGSVLAGSALVRPDPRPGSKHQRRDRWVPLDLLELAEEADKPTLLVWTCTDHNSRYDHGGASVVVARSQLRAEEVLADRLREAGLETRFFTLQPLRLDREQAIILRDGDY